MALKVAPLRDKSIKKAKRKPGMSTEEFKDKIKKERRAREKDASRVSAELDSKGIISDVRFLPEMPFIRTPRTLTDARCGNSLRQLSSTSWSELVPISPVNNSFCASLFLRC